MRKWKNRPRTCVGIIDYQGRDTLGGDDTGGGVDHNDNGADGGSAHGQSEVAPVGLRTPEQR